MGRAFLRVFVFLVVLLQLLLHFATSRDSPVASKWLSSRETYNVHDEAVDLEGQPSDAGFVPIFPEERAVHEESIDNSDLFRELKDTKAVEADENWKKDFQALKSTVASMSQQIDALVRQQSETLKLFSARTSDVDQRSSNGLTKQTSTSKKELQVTTTGGVTYTRWGRTQCNIASGAQQLYKGFLASSYYFYPGGGSNILCLHEDPQWGKYYTGVQFYSGQIYGGTYLLNASYGSPFSTANNHNMDLSHNAAPCVVCHSALRSNQVMIPARRTCPVGWTQEYRGYLVSAGTLESSSTHYWYQKSSYICLDEAPETVPGKRGVSGDSRLVPVQARCGALPCPKYVDGYEVACVVCSK